MDIEEKRIREFAYQIWQSEGEPEGHEMRHWEMARKLAEAESSSAPAHTESAFPDAVIGHDSDDHPAKADNATGEQSAVTHLELLDSGSPRKQ
jgi:hypothetical protein